MTYGSLELSGDALFTDEPNVSSSRVYDGGAAALPFSCWFTRG